MKRWAATMIVAAAAIVACGAEPAPDTVTISRTGCMDVTLSDGRTLSALKPEGGEFWGLMAKAAGVAEDELLRQEWPAP